MKRKMKTARQLIEQLNQQSPKRPSHQHIQTFVFLLHLLCKGFDGRFRSQILGDWVSVRPTELATRVSGSWEATVVNGGKRERSKWSTEAYGGL